MASGIWWRCSLAGISEVKKGQKWRPPGVTTTHWTREKLVSSDESELVLFAN